MKVQVELCGEADELVLVHEYIGVDSKDSSDIVETPDEMFEIPGEGSIRIIVKFWLANYLTTVIVHQNDTLLLHVGFDAHNPPPFVVRLQNGSYIQLYFDLETELQRRDTQNSYVSLQWDAQRIDAIVLKEFKLLVPDMRYVVPEAIKSILSNGSEWPLGIRSEAEIEKIKKISKRFKIALQHMDC